MPLNFTVADDGLQRLLESVAQPPPTLPLDPSSPDSPKVLDAMQTPAVHFCLVETTKPASVPPQAPNLEYHGLLFFQPGNPNTISGGLQPALRGVGAYRMETQTCLNKVGGKFPDRTREHQFIQLILRFRPPKMFCFLSFAAGTTPAREVQMDSVEIFTPFGGIPVSMHLMGGAEGHWSLTMDKGTVLDHFL